MRCSSTTCSASAWTCSARTARATASTRAIRRSDGAGQARHGRASKCMPITRPVDFGAAARLAAGRAAAVDAALAARSAQPVHDRALLARALPAEPMAPRPPTRASATSRRRVRGLLRRPDAHADRAPRAALAAREEGSGGSAVRAGQADRLLARPQHPARVPRRGDARASSSGTRRSRRSASATPSRCGQQPDDADFDPEDIDVQHVPLDHQRDAGVRAIGPSPRQPAHRRDPRRRHHLREPRRRAPVARSCRSQVLPNGDRLDRGLDAAVAAPTSAERPARPARPASHADQLRPTRWPMRSTCWTARGDLDPAGPEAQQIRASSYLTDEVTMHEVGHTLGLRHNFKASTHAQRTSSCTTPAITREQGLVGSVMDYSPVNLARPGRQAGRLLHDDARPVRLLGHRVRLQAARPGPTRAAELKKIAARGDEAAARLRHRRGHLPRHRSRRAAASTSATTRWRSPRSASRSRATCSGARKRARSRPTRTTRVLRRSVRYAVVDVGQTRSACWRARSAACARCATSPAAAATRCSRCRRSAQRDALDVLARGVFVADAFVVSPALQRRLAPDFVDRSDAVFGGGGRRDRLLARRRACGELQRSLLGAA